MNVPISYSGVIVLGSTAFAAWLLPSSGTGLPGWLAGVTIAAGCVAGAVMLAELVDKEKSEDAHDEDQEG